MTSTDSSLVVEIGGEKYAVLNDRLEALEHSNQEIHAEIRELDKKIDLLLVRLDGMNERIEDMKFYVSLSFGVLAVFVGVAAMIPVVSKLVQTLLKPALSREQVSAMINEAVTQAMSNH